MKVDEGEFKRVGEDVVVYPLAKIIHKSSVSIGDHVIIDDFVFIMGGIEATIGRHVHLASFVSVTGGGSFQIGDFSGIATGSRILTGTDDFSGTSLTNSTIPQEFRNVERSFVKIGRHAVIGANSIVLPGVIIGEGATIGACSIVTRDIEPWTVNWGIPARAMKERNKERILELEVLLDERDR